MRTPARRVAALTVVVVVSLLTWAPSSPAAAAGPYTSWAVSGERGDDIVGGIGYTGTDVQLDGDDHQITGDLGPWALWIIAAEGDTLRAGQTYPVTGSPGTPGSGAVMSFFGPQSSGCSALSGSFTLRELTFRADGGVDSILITFSVKCASDPDPGRAYGSAALRASTPAPPVPPALGLKMSTKKVAYGATVSAEARVSAGVPGTVVSLYRRTSGGTEELVTQAAADAQGKVAITLRVVETTTVIARIPGDGTYPDRVVSETVPVGAKLKAKVLSKGPTRGGTRLVPVRRDAVVGARLLPGHAGDCIKFRLELRVRGSWTKPLPTKCLKLSASSAVAVRVPGDRG